jgi:FkbM family methyltransferase
LIETIHRIGSRIRHSPLLERQRWLWERVEPYWEATFERASKNSGYATHVNGDVFVVEYALGARYDRQDQRSYEPVFYRAFVDRIQPGMQVADLGAHVGFFTLGAALRAGDRGKVFSFEPSPSTVASLRRNVALNRWQDRVEVIEAAVSDKEGFVSFFTNGTSMAASLSRNNVEVLNPEHPAAATEVTVRSLTLDQVCKSRQARLDVIKIDVEGAELLALRGAREVLQTDRPVILCEIHPLQMQQCGCTVEELKQFIGSLRYALEPLDEPNPAGIFHAVLAPGK